MSGRLEGISTVVLTLAAIVMAGAVVKRELTVDARASTTHSSARAEYHAAWVEARAIGIELANPKAALQIVEFLDIECPACAAYHSRAVQPFIRFTDPADYSLVVVHRPLAMHEFAVPAAQAAECADAQGAFRPFVETALTQQAEFSSSPWLTIAERSGVENLTLFSSCVGEDREFPRVSAGVELATRMGISATPTVVVNGWEIPFPPNLEALQSFVAGVKAGRDIRDLVQGR